MMKIICVVKFVPDVDNFSYDYENHVLIRENSRLMINPDDACAIGFALEMKNRKPEVFIEALTMAPRSVVPLMEDLLRVGVDRGTVITDRRFAGSDTFVTSRILGRSLSGREFDAILTGTHAIDGDTSHVPSQIAEILDLNQMSGIIGIDGECFMPSALVEVEDEKSRRKYEIDLPAVLSLTRESGYRLPYVRHKNLNLDVSDRLFCLDNEALGFEEGETGLSGSPTKVSRSYTKTYQEREQRLVGTDQKGIDLVYDFLKEKRFV